MKILKTPSILMRLIFILSFLSSCSKWNDYKKYLEGGEIHYTGKMDSVKVSPGYLRVKIEGLLSVDPTISKCVISWINNNLERDSIVFPISKSGTTALFNETFEVDEGTKNFNIQTFDDQNNSSVIVQAIGTVYGPEYENTLFNRPVSSAKLFSDQQLVIIKWSDIDSTSGAKGTIVSYLNNVGDSMSKFVPVGKESDTLLNYKVGTEFVFKTIYLPDTLAIDSFYTSISSFSPEIQYLNNLGNPFEHAEWDGSRWGLLAGWVTNSDVKNAGGDQFGGFELRNDVGVLSFESGWGNRDVPNGKIYQNTTLPPGKYSFRPIISERGGGTVYAVVSLEPELPDFDEVTSESLACTLQGNLGDAVQFEVNETTTVSLGFVGRMTGDSYFKVSQIEFEKIN